MEKKKADDSVVVCSMKKASGVVVCSVIKTAGTVVFRAKTDDTDVCSIYKI